jgi:uncharacterized protein YbjT (DUF2867 family)
METWAGIVGGPILASGKARIFGRGRNPINFVSSTDVAAVVDGELGRVVADPAAPSRTIEVIGPEDLSFDTIVEAFASALGRPVPAAHAPLAMLRAMAVALRPFKPVLADQIAAAVVLDTTNRRGTTGPTEAGRTLMRGTRTFDEVIHDMVVARPSAETVPTRA